jgi:hypothetical protein
MKLFKANAKKIRGQGMSEYMIIVALIAIAGIVTMSLFGSTARSQVASMAAEIAGQDGTAANGNAQTAAADAATDAVDNRNMGTFQGRQP